MKINIFYILICLILIFEYLFNYSNFENFNPKEIETEIEKESTKDNFDNIVIYDNNDEIMENNPNNFLKKDDSDEEKDNITESMMNNLEKITFNEPNPWNHIIVDKHFTKYFIKLNVFDKKIYNLWKNLNDKLEFDEEGMYLIINVKDECEALAITNLILSNIVGAIDFEEIISNNLIELSIRKAKAHKLVCKKLIELIKENNMSKEMFINNNYTSDLSNNKQNYEIEDLNNITNDININNNFDEVENFNNYNKNVDIIYEEKTFSNNQNLDPIAYGGSEYSLI